MQKIAIILGTSSSLGQAVTKSLLRRGFFVYGGSINETPIEHERFIDIELDITQKNHIQNFIDEVKNDTEVVDVFINLISFCELNSFSDSKDLDLRMHLETNVIGYFNFLKKFEPFLMQEQTHMINFYSISAKTTYPNTISFTTSEHAKKAFLAVLEKEWKKYDLRFSNLFLGAIDSDFWDDYPEAERDKMLKISDVIFMLETLLDTPEHIQIPEITMLHREGFID